MLPGNRWEWQAATPRPPAQHRPRAARTTLSAAHRPTRRSSQKAARLRGPPLSRSNLVGDQANHQRSAMRLPSSIHILPMVPVVGQLGRRERPRSWRTSERRWRRRSRMMSTAFRGTSRHAWCRVQFGACFQQQRLEPLVFPEVVVPRHTRFIGGREHPVFRGSARPVASAERLFLPDIRPVAVVRLAHDVDVDACGRRPKPGSETELRRLHPGRPCRRPTGKPTGLVVDASLFQVELGLVRIVLEFCSRSAA